MDGFSEFGISGFQDFWIFGFWDFWIGFLSPGDWLFRILDLGPLGPGRTRPGPGWPGPGPGLENVEQTIIFSSEEKTRNVRTIKMPAVSRRDL